MAVIGIAAGHTRACVGTRLYEHERCYLASEMLVSLLRAAGHDARAVPETLYDLDNDESLHRRVQLFNDWGTELNLELHLNGGGGNYSTCLYWAGGEDSRTAQLAALVEDGVAALMLWRSIGARTETFFGRSDLAFLNDTHASSVIVEPAFKDNIEHAQWIDSPAFAAEYAATVFTGIQCYLKQAEV